MKIGLPRSVTHLAIMDSNRQLYPPPWPIDPEHCGCRHPGCYCGPMVLWGCELDEDTNGVMGMYRISLN